MELENKKNSKLLGLKKLKDKLLNLNPLYNRKIRFSLSERLTWDLTELLNQNDPTNIFPSSILNLLNSQEVKENFSLDLESFFQSSTPEVISRFQKKVVHLQKKNLAVQQEKGYKALFLGIIFVRGYFYNNQNILRLVNAPLFLLPCDFDVKKTKKLSLFFYSERKINYNLLYYLQKELGLAKEKLTDFLIRLENNKGIERWENYLSFLTQELQTLVAASPVKIKLSRTISSLMREKNNFLTEREEKSRGTSISPFTESDSKISHHNLTDRSQQQWPESEHKSNRFFSDEEWKSEYFQPEPFVGLTLSNKPKNYPENELEIVLNFCLTIDSEPNLSLFRDFEEIIEEYSQDKTINWSKSALALLKGEVESVLSYPEPQETSQQVKPLYLPFASDPSQTHILKKIFRDFVQSTLCIDGPPGTGKSQLICNLLSNALAYQKKVLVVCEKEVALKVIADKLSSIGLNPSLIKISKLDQTPQIYQEILSHLENNQQVKVSHYYFNNEKQIVNLEAKRKSNLEKITNYCQVEDKFRSTRQVPLSEIYLKFESEKQPPPTLIQLNKGIKNKEQLDKLKIDLKNYFSRFSKILVKWKPICLQLKNIFLINNFLPFEFNWENKNNFQKIINDLLREIKGEKGETNLLSQILRINLAGECSENHQSTKLLESKIKDLVELQTNPNYQNFFTFLQIENFTDFWQKCSDKEYLLTTQQFISEEFLIIGNELNFFLANFTENTKKNIDYFLQKVLVNQEFNCLENYSEICEQAVYFNWIKEIEEENKEVLAYWNQSELTRIQNEQREINQEKKDLVKGILKNKQKFNLDNLSTNQLLMKELNKKRIIPPLKKLFPELVNYLPIWLTTPDVIASITNWREVTFDFLIFDEASQVLLEKSIPLWARAKKCIVIGDEKQMPPTDIFKSHLEDNEEIWEKEEKIEKLLSEAGKNINLEIDDLGKNSNLLTYAKKYARSRKKLTLLYHYRSKYPELIEFSNQAFYNGILQIVSASEIRKKEDTLPIEYHHQDKGYWINNENEVEARYIANLLRTLPKDKEVGIITFNVKQRDLLIDLIGEGNNTSSQKDSKWKDLTDSLRGSQEVHSRFDEFITKIYWLFREKKGKPRGMITEIDFQGFKGFRTDKELRGKRKYRVYGRCDAKFSMKKNQPETETGKISILINQLYLLDKLGMDKVAASYSETESWREQEFADINFDKLINTIAHELAHAYQDTIHIRKPDNAIKSQCESSGKKDRNGNFLYPDKVVEHTQFTAEIEKMTIALSEYQEFKIWWTSKSPPEKEESCRVEKNNDNKSLSEKENCEYCGKIKSYNCCERNLQAQNKSNNLFIKNLEEVQGDERDIIIFSIGYARNEEGKFYLRFGPLGQKGGEKRLNVAISRAREKIIIVTSLLPNDLNRITDEDENRNLGPKLFKKYLEYAYYCGKNQPERVQGILKKLPGIANSSLYEKDSGLKDFDSLFEEKIYNELVKNIERYEVHKQVKSVGYHIDLAIWDNQTQQYILGIECDGYYWHSQLKDIERDIYRQQLLENKGWKIIRILSRDWSRNKEKEIERVKKEISRIV